MHDIDKADQENQVFKNSTRSTIDWWKGLNHNWKKNLLANLDFNRKFKEDYDAVDSLVSQKGLYNAYYFQFNRGIRNRLNEFIVTEEALTEILSLKCLVLRSHGLKSASPLNKFLNIQILNMLQFQDEELFIQVPKMEMLKVLRLGQMSSLKGISNWTSLEKICYYQSPNTVGQEELRLCKNLKDIRTNIPRGHYVELGPDFFNIEGVMELK